MPFLLDVSVVFLARQGLPFPAARKRLAPGESVEVVLWADHLADGPWTERFDFRPTFELMARHIYGKLVSDIPGLTFVELEDRTYGTHTRFTEG